MALKPTNAAPQQDDAQPRFTVADLQQQLEPLLSGLFGAFSQPESGENQYVMKCIARLIVFVGPQVCLCSEARVDSQQAAMPACGLSSSALSNLWHGVCSQRFMGGRRLRRVYKLATYC